MQKIIKVLIPSDLHREFKTACASNAETITDAIIELIEFYIKNEPLKLKEDAKK